MYHTSLSNLYGLCLSILSFSCERWASELQSQEARLRASTRIATISPIVAAKLVRNFGEVGFLERTGDIGNNHIVLYKFITSDSF